MSSSSPFDALRSAAAPIAILMLFCALNACSRDPQTRAERHVRSGDQYARQGKVVEAILEYRNAVQAQPQNAHARLKLAEAYSTARDFAAAAREYVRAADLMPGRVDVQLRAGNLCLMGGRFDDARVRANKALAVAPEEVEAHVLLAGALAGLRDFEAAVVETERAIRLAPDRANTYAGLGALEMARGRVDAAENAFKKATALDHTSAAPHLALANFYWIRERNADAEQAVKRALAFEPTSQAAHRVMASFALALNRPAEAEAHLTKVLGLTKAPDDALALADFYISRRAEASARSVLAALEKTPAAALAAVRLATLDHAAGRTERAYARLDQILEKTPADSEALVARSRLLLADGRHDEAVAFARKAVAASPAHSSAARVALGAAQAAKRDTNAAANAYADALRANPRAGAAHLGLARLNLAAGRTAEGLASAEQAVKINPTDSDARLVLARGLIARGDYKRAESELTRLSAENPTSAAVRIERGLLFARQKQFTEARREFEAALELLPDSVEALGGLIAIDLATKQPETARVRVQARVERADADARTLMLGARTHLATGDTPTGEMLLRRVLQKDASYLPAYAALGQLYLRGRRLEAALAEFEAMAEHDPRPVPALTMAGIILEAQGKAADARQRYQRALQVDPNAAVAANNLAWLNAVSGENLDLALQLAQTAYSRLPDSLEAGDTLAFIYYKKNLLPQALQILTRIAAKQPTEPLYQYHLGLVLAKSGDRPGAIKHLSRALALKPDFDGASEARALLEKTRS